MRKLYIAIAIISAIALALCIYYFDTLPRYNIWLKFFAALGLLFSIGVLLFDKRPQYGLDVE